MKKSIMLVTTACACIAAAMTAPAWAQQGTAPTGQAGTPMPNEPSPPAGGTIPAQSAPVEGATTGLADIIVTAQKRAENLQKVPVAVSVATASQLQASGIASIQSLKIAAPGVEVLSNNGYALPVIRGVGSKATGAGIETPIAIYVDGVYYGAASSTILEFNNIAQVEVLKGPQGTLFGRNATGGLIQVTTRDPEADLGGEVNLSYGNYQTFKGDAYLTGAVADGLAADIAVQVTAMGKGYGTNTFNGEDVGRIYHDVAVRSKWLATLNDSTEARFILDYNNNRNNQMVQRLIPGETAPPPFGPNYAGSPWDADLSTQPAMKTHGGGGSIRIDHEMDALKIASITAYRRNYLDLFVDQDNTRTDGRYFHVRQKDWQFSQELQLLSNNDGPLQWVLGGYYFRARSRYPFVTIFFNGPDRAATANPNVRADTISYQDTESLAAFGQATWEILPNLKLTGGLRYTHEERTLAGFAYLTRLDGSTLTTQQPVERSQTHKKLTWRAAIDYSFGNDALIYASFNRGFKSGGFNPATFSVPAFEPEVLDAYEAGFKTTLFDRRLRFNGSAFYYDYSNVQVQRYFGSTAAIYNGAKAKVKGFETELVAQVTEQLNLRATYQYLDGEYKSFPNAVLASRNPAGGYVVSQGSAAGNDTVLTPKSTLGLVGNLTLPVGDGKVNFNGSYYYNSGFFHEPDNVLRQPSYSLINASVRWTAPEDRFSVSVWGNNLTNKAVMNLGALQGISAVAVAKASYAPPRTYGVTVGTKF